jgi:hypothetical protein
MLRQVFTCVPQRVRGVQPSLPRAKNPHEFLQMFSLDMIFAVGCRVKSSRGTQFRQWATQILHECLQKGFALNDEILKNMGGGVYWKELLERIRDMRKRLADGGAGV